MLDETYFWQRPISAITPVLAILLSAGLMLADSRLDAFANVRYFLNSAIAPLQYAANLPRELLDSMSGQFSSRQTLLVENKALKRDLLVMQSNVLLLESIKARKQAIT